MVTPTPMASSAGTLINATATLISTLIGGAIAFLVAQSRLKSERSLDIDDWYSRSNLLADQVQRAKPEDYGKAKERQVTHQKMKSLGQRADEHVASAPGGVSIDIAQALDNLAKECYRLAYLEPNDTADFRETVQNAVEKAQELEDAIERRNL